MRKDNLVGILLVIYLYATSILLFVKPFINFGYFTNSILLMLFLAALYLNKFRLKKIFIIGYSVIFILIGFNLFSSDIFAYVFTDSVHFVTYSLLPIYVLSHFKVNIKIFLYYWKNISVILTLLLPLYYIYLKMEFINYAEIGTLTHLNIIITVYYIFIEKKGGKIFNTALLIINFGVMIILGSRMVSLATIVCIFVVFLCSKKNIKFYIISFIGLIGSYFLLSNLVYLLTILYDYFYSKGINSRNLRMFILQFQTENISDNNVLLSGRESIYPIVIQYLELEGIFPSGLAYVRYLTAEHYAHTHNFVLEICLVFGIVIGPLLLLYLIIKAVFALRGEKKVIFLILGTSFVVRSITGTYFVLDPIFMIILSIILSTPFKTENLNKRRKYANYE